MYDGHVTLPHPGWTLTSLIGRESLPQNVPQPPQELFHNENTSNSSLPARSGRPPQGIGSIMHVDKLILGAKGGPNH